jgi:hypothetical protein
MSHARTLLRTAVVAALGVGAVPLLAGRVATGRVWPEQPGALPAARVYTDQEQLAATLGAEAYQREITVRVEIRAQGIEGAIDDAIDDCCEEVEAALAGLLSVGGTSMRVLYQATDIEFEREGEYATALAVLTFRATLFTQATAPGTVL